MAKQIKQKDIIVDDVWGKTIKSTEELLNVVNRLDEQLIKLGKDAKKSLNFKGDENLKGLKGVNEAVNRTNKLYDKKLVIDRERIKLEQKLERLNSTRIDKNTILKEQIREQTKRNKDLARETLKLTTEYQKQSKRLTELRNRAKELGLQFGLNSKEFRTAQKEVVKLDRDLKKLDSSLGQSQRQVGRYERALGGLKNILGAAGIVGGVQLFARAIRNSFQRIRDFDKELTNIAAVSGSTREELKDLETVIISVAGSSIKTSNEVAQLATVLITLGKTKEEVKLLLKPVNDLSIALGATSEETADFLGQTLNAFGRGAESGQEFADVIANVRSSTSLDFERIKDAFGFVAPTANALGLTLGETSALIGVLQDNGIKAARAGRLLSSSFARLAADGITLEDALQQINESQDKVLTSSELFGKEAFTLGLILADNTEKVAKLSNEFDNLSEGSLKELTDKQLDSLDAKIKILDSTWEQFLLSIENGEGFLATSLKSTLVFLADNLSNLIKIVATLTTAFLSYKLVAASTRAALIAYDGVVKLLAVSKNILSNGINKANLSMKAFNATTKENPIGALISLLTIVVGLFLTFKENADQAAESQRELNEAQRESLRIQESLTSIEDRVAAVDKLNKEQLDNLLRSIDQELAANQAKQAKLLGNERSISKESIEIRESAAARIIELEQEIAEESDEFKRQELRGSLQLFKQREEAAAIYAQTNSDISEGITNKEVEENIKKLQSDRELVESRLKLLKDSNEEIAKRNKDVDLIDTRSGLDRLKDELSKIQTLREDVVDKGDSASRSLFRALNKRADFLQNLIEAYERRLKEGEFDYSDEQLALFDKNAKLLKERTDKALTEAEEQRLKEVAQIEKEEAEKQALRQKTLEVTEALANRQFEERIRLADREVEAQKQRQGELQSLAAQGNADAAASLAENQKKQAQAEQQKQELLEKQKQFELALAVVNAFNAELDANPTGGSGPALAKALTSTTVLTSFVSSLPAFKDGTEDTGNGGGLDGYGGFHAILHPNERVLTKEQNSKIGGRKNDEVADIMDNYNKGLLIDLDKHNTPKLKLDAKPFDTGAELLRKFDKMEKSIVNAISSKETYLGSDIDTIKQVITKTFKQGNKVVKQNSRSPRI